MTSADISDVPFQERVYDALYRLATPLVVRGMASNPLMRYKAVTQDTIFHFVTHCVYCTLWRMNCINYKAGSKICDGDLPSDFNLEEEVEYILTDLEAIASNSRCKDFSADKKPIFLHTTPLLFRDPEEPKHWYDLGDVRIMLTPKRFAMIGVQNSYFHCEGYHVIVVRSGYTTGENRHPYSASEDLYPGGFCFGDMNRDVAHLVRNRDIIALLNVTLEALSRVNETSWHGIRTFYRLHVPG